MKGMRQMTDAERLERSPWLDIPCPLCGAKRMQWCGKPFGKKGVWEMAHHPCDQRVEAARGR